MKKIALILTLIGVTLFSVGCTKSPETPINSIDNNTTVVIDNNITDSNSTDNIAIVNVDDTQTTNSTGKLAVVSNNNTTDKIGVLISKIKNKKLTSSEERKVYSSFNSVSNTYPITMNGVKVKSYDRTLRYDHINGHNLTACTRTKDVIMTSNNKTKKFRVCQTTNYDWIVK